MREKRYASMTDWSTLLQALETLRSDPARGLSQQEAARQQDFGLMSSRGSSLPCEAVSGPISRIPGAAPGGRCCYFSLLGRLQMPWLS